MITREKINLEEDEEYTEDLDGVLYREKIYHLWKNPDKGLVLTKPELLELRDKIERILK